jgi:hypothetical protein
VLAIACMALPLAGCGLQHPDYGVARVSASGATAYLPSAALESAAGAMRSAPSVRFEIDSWLDAGELQSGVDAVGAMDLTRKALTMTRKYKSAWNGPWETERQTVVKNRVYLQVPGVSDWLRFTPGQAREAGLDASGSDPVAIPDLLGHVKDEARRMGRETVAGVETTKYHAVLTDVTIPGNARGGWQAIGLESMTFTAHLSDDKLPIRVAINASGHAEIDGRQTPTSLSLTVTYTGWGESVRVRAPKSSVSAEAAGVLDQLRAQDDLPTV